MRTERGVRKGSLASALTGGGGGGKVLSQGSLRERERERDASGCGAPRRPLLHALHISASHMPIAARCFTLRERGEVVRWREGAGAASWLRAACPDAKSDFLEWRSVGGALGTKMIWRSRRILSRSAAASAHMRSAGTPPPLYDLQQTSRAKTRTDAAMREQC